MVVETIKEIKPGKIVIFGANGMLGYALRQAFPAASLFGHQDVEISNKDAIMKIVKHESPSVVINAAAYTNVDGCEEKRDHALMVNGTGPGYIAAACSEIKATLIHYSSDYVFDGKKPEYSEGDTPNPINVYGESKLLGEVLIQKNMDDYRIIRTSWLFGSHGKNFVDTVLALSRQMSFVSVVNDQIGKPTYSSDLAYKTPEIILREPGIYHITNEGQCSWYEFAKAFIPNAVPCSSAEFPRKAKRPAYSVLKNTKTAHLRSWKEALAEYIEKGDYKI